MGANGGTVQGCYSTATVSGTGNQAGVGGLVGSNTGTVQGCYSTGNVSCTGEANNLGGGVGGLVGVSYGGSTLQGCYSTATVSGNRNVGGVVGYVYNEPSSCVSLGERVIRSAGDLTAYHGRVVGAFRSDGGANNKARSDMRVMDALIKDGSATNKNGADVAVDGTVAQSTVFDAAAFPAGDWIIPAGNLTIKGALPTLQGFTSQAEVKLPGKILVTIDGLTAKEGLTYSGKAQQGYTGTVTVKEGGTAITTPENLVYTYTSTDSGGYSSTTTAPTDAGKYKLVVSVPEANAEYTGKLELNFEIAKAPLTITGSTVTTKEYDGNNTATVTGLTLSGTENNETLSLGTDYTVSATFADKNAGNNKAVTTTVGLKTTAKAKNYKLVNTTIPGLTGNITQKILSIDGGTVASKVYDGKTDATVTGITLSGAISGETLTLDTDYTVSAKFDGADVSSSDFVTITVKFIDTSELAKNYSLHNKGHVGSSAAITKATYAPLPALTMKIPNGNVNIGTIRLGNLFDAVPMDASFGTITPPGTVKIMDSVTVGDSAEIINYNSKTNNAGTTSSDVYKVVITSKNYQDFEATITFKAVDKKAVTIDGLTAEAGLIYSGLPQQGYTGTVTVKEGGTAITTPENLVYTYTSTDSGGYSSTTAPTNAGAYKLVVSVPEANAEYTGASGEILFTIGQKELTITGSTVASKEYDGNNTATVTGLTLSGTVNDEVLLLTADYTVSAATFADKNAGKNKAVTVTVGLTTTDKAKNYKLANTTIPGLTGDITPKPLTISKGTVKQKWYDGKTDAEITALTFSGEISGEKLAINTDYTVGTPTFDNANAGSNKAVTGTAALTNTDKAKNYTLTGAYTISGVTINKATYPSEQAPAITVNIQNGAVRKGTITLEDLFGAGNVPAGAVIEQINGSDTNIMNSVTHDGNTITYTSENNAVGTKKSDGRYLGFTTTNYNQVTAAITFKAVDKTAVTIAGLTAEAGLIYNGLPQKVYTGTVTVTGGTVNVNDLVYTYTSTDSGGYSSTTTAPTNAGAYKLVISVPDNNTDYTGQLELNFTIGQKELTITGGTVAEKVYDGNNTATVTGLTLSGTENNETLSLGTDYTVSATFADKNAGENKAVTATVSLATTPTAKNYKLANTTIPSLAGNITKKALTIKGGTVAAKEYDGKTNATVTGLVFEGRVSSDTLAIDTDYTVGTPAFDNANAGSDRTVTGTAALTNTVKAKNYSLTGAYAISGVTIYKATYQGTAPAKTVNIQNGKEHTGDITVADLFANIPTGASFGNVTPPGTVAIMASVTASGNTITYRSNTNAVGTTGSEEYTVKITSENYQDITATITFKAVDKKTVTFTAAPQAGLIYSGKAQGYTGTVTAAAEGADIPTPENLVYTYTGTDGTKYTTAPTKADTYKLVISVPDNNTDYTGKSELNFVIAQKPLTITASSYSTYQYDMLPSLADTVVYAGFAEGEGSTSLTATYAAAYATGVNTDTDGDKVIEIKATGTEANANYDIKTVTGKLTVHPGGKIDNPPAALPDTPATTPVIVAQPQDSAKLLRAISAALSDGERSAADLWLKTQQVKPTDITGAYELNLLISTDNGNSWAKATTADVQNNLVQVAVPVPTGTLPETHSYTLFHFANGAQAAADTLTATYNAASGTLCATVTSLSPFVVVATPKAAPPTPPTSVPPTSVPPTSVPPTSVPPTSVPPTSVPPTSEPPASKPTTPPTSGADSIDYETRLWLAVVSRIQAAAKGDVIRINTGDYNSMPATVMEELRLKGAGMVISRNGGKEITIPAGKAQNAENGRAVWPYSQLTELYNQYTFVKDKAKENPSTGGYSYYNSDTDTAAPVTGNIIEVANGGKYEKYVLGVIMAMLAAAAVAAAIVIKKKQNHN